MTWTWNHRVVRTPTSDGSFYQIHECHYAKRGDAVPHSMTVDGVAPGGRSVEELREALLRMLACLDHPVLQCVDDKVTEYVE